MEGQNLLLSSEEMIRLYLIALLIVFFWVGAWGIIEHFVAKSHSPIFWYSVMFLVTGVIIIMYPSLVQHFV